MTTANLDISRVAAAMLDVVVVSGFSARWRQRTENKTTSSPLLSLYCEIPQHFIQIILKGKKGTPLLLFSFTNQRKILWFYPHYHHFNDNQLLVTFHSIIIIKIIMYYNTNISLIITRHYIKWHSETYWNTVHVWVLFIVFKGSSEDKNYITILL